MTPRLRTATAPAVAAVLALLAASCSGSSGGGPAPGPAPARQSAITDLSILPPGAETGPSQEQMYDALTKVAPGTLTDADLTKYYKPAPLDPAPADVASRSTPRAGVTIVRDRFGVPYVYGKTDDDTAYGAGYAGTQDRMFVMDALRYAGAGRRSELLGASADNLAADADQLRQADYTPAEAQAQIDAVGRSGPAGAAMLSRLHSFVAGVNAARAALCPTVTAATCPAPYRLLKITPKPYTDSDIVYAASLVGGIFGKGGGDEARNALFLQQLQRSLGKAEGRTVLSDLQDPADPEAPVTVPGDQPYGAPGKTDQAAVALPDLTGKLAAGTGPVPDTARPPTASTAAASSGGGAGAGGLDLGMDPAVKVHASNALLIAGSHTADGHPVAVFGPQTGYQAPNFFDEIALHGPHYQARGVAFANLQFVVLIGRGRSYAWSATSSSGDVVDTVLDRLCNTDGAAATVTSKGYRDGSRCVPMTGVEHVEHAGGGTGAVIATLPDLRTRHGIVQYRTTAGGVPVAVVTQRSTYGHEPDSVLGFAAMNDPAEIHGAADFTKAFGQVRFTFNWFYADTRDIATFTSGSLPIRAAGVDPDLPRWGDAKWDWTGYLPDAKHPQVVDPPTGYLVNWNNKPSVGTWSADDEWGWGPIQRMLTLRDRITAAIAKGKVTRSGLVAAMTDASTVDVRGAYLLDEMLAVVGKDPALAKYTDLLAAWQKSGAHRVDRARTGHDSDSAAIALFDAWFPPAARSVLADRIGGDLVDALPKKLNDNTPTGHGGSSFDNVAGYGLLDKDLRAVLGRKVDGPLSQGYCGKGAEAACQASLRAALTTAVATVTKDQKTADTARWSYADSQDEIRFDYVGSTVPAIPWQNRPTFQQVVGTAG